ncbi:MAG: hypothetical protein AB7O62_03630 [Pirellulales bacterium]
MATSFDPYAEWLNIPKQKVHPDRYRLLNLPAFEGDPAVIEQAAAAQVRHVSQHQQGPQADAANRLIEELQNAKVCLLDASKKALYDAALRQQLAARGESVASVPVAVPAAAAEPISQAAAAPAASEIDDFLPPVADVDALLPTPVAPQPVMAQPPVAQPVMAQPVMAQPVMAQPVAAQPVMAQPYGGVPQAVAVPAYGSPPVAQAVPAYPTAQPVPAAASLLDDDAPTAAMGMPSAMPGSATRAAARRSRGNAAPVFLGVAVMLAVVGGAGYYMVQAGFIKLGQPAGPTVAVVETPNTQPTSRPPSTRPAPTPRPGDVEIAPMRPNDDLASTERPGKKTDEMPADMPDESMDEPDGMDSDKPDSMPDDESEDKPAKPTKPAATGKVSEILAEARAAMAAKDMQTATQLVGKAEEAANESEKGEVERVKLLLAYVEQFWKGFDEALKAIPEGEDFEYKDDRISIVEKDPKFIILRTGGKNRTWSMDALPSRLAMTLADRYFNDDPANDLARGAFLVVHPKGDREKAREHWSAAARRGLKDQVDELLLELDVPIAVASDDEPPAMDAKVPPAAIVTTAREDVRKRYADDFNMAVDAAERIVLADKLLGQALESQDNPERYALLLEARDMAGLSGDTETLTRVADALANIYKADAEEETTRGLDAAAKAADSPEASAVVAQAALYLTDVAMLSERPKVALARVKVAVAAANKSGDKDLKKQAILQQKDVKAQAK